MKTLPPLLIVTDRGHLVAYRVSEDDRPRQLCSIEFVEATSKLSDLVTDQAGAFVNTGSIGTSAAERLPLVAELEMRAFRRIAEEIHELVSQEGVRRWGLCAPAEIHGAVVDFLDSGDRAKLALQVKRNHVNSSPEQVRAAFEKAAVPEWEA